MLGTGYYASISTPPFYAYNCLWKSCSPTKLNNINDDEFDTNSIDAIELEHTNDDDDACDKDTNLQRKRKKTSNVWRHFEELPKGIDGRKRAKCNYCKSEYIHDSRFGTGNLQRHICILS
ncbi:hypothetical protein Scep_015568 [Stephania cephalantha]|uniref:BED-type domain-containing protein n=1 Tax=Stephania cephalantha TaxID=152367 RepID=A0AAP0J5L7_9MAGN